MRSKRRLRPEIKAFIDKAEDIHADVICMSALLTTTMPYMKEVVDHFKGRGVKVIIGGAPITEEYAANSARFTRRNAFLEAMAFHYPDRIIRSCKRSSEQR